MSGARSPRAIERTLAGLVRAHDRWRGAEVFNLLASENAISPTARRYLSSDLAGRYTLPLDLLRDGERIDNGYAGTRYADRIEAIGDAAASRLFGGRFATLRPLSGHIAALSVLATLLPRGSRLLAIPPEEGGYDGYAPGFLPALLGLKVRPLPTQGAARRLDAGEVARAIRRERPQAVVVGQSFWLFPYPLREIAEAAHAAGALVIYDGAHVLGLIAGGEFQDPLGEGADVLLGSTHKSLPGPQGGLIVTERRDLFERIAPALVWRTLDNVHENRIAGVAQTLLELERWGKAYARTTVKNAQTLGRHLERRGLPLVAAHEGFTRSHQLWIDGERLRRASGLGPAALARRLERQRLLIDLVGRIGTAEITRLGLGPKEMPRLAELLVRAGVGGEKVGPRVLRWRRRFRALRFR